MSRPVLNALVVLVGAGVASSATPAFAQLARAPKAMTLRASVGVEPGMVSGVVRDEEGDLVAGVAVSAIGTSQAQVRTDVNGQFNLPLTPGEYMLRATRDGYVSPYKELVRIGASQRLQRNIRITKQPPLPERKVLAASLTPSLTGERPAARPAASASSQSVQAWWLRQVPRTILRDESGKKGNDRADIKYLPSFLDWVVAESAQAATSFFADTHFSGQINVLTSSAISSSQGWLPDGLPRGIAYLAVGAPVGVHGDWRLRGAMSTGGLASWVALAEYEARPVKTHAFRIAASYGEQRAADRFGMALLTSSERGRSVASIDGRDRWRVQPGVELDYGLRLDRYDYVNGQDFVSPRIGARMMVAPRMFVTGLASRAVLAPGADEFLPPPTSGPWLPPERTFASLVRRAPIRPELIERYEAGLEREFGMIGQSRTIGVRWFHESTRNQMATIFGLSDRGAVGHYFVATPGDVRLEGVAVRLSGQFTSRVKASMDYSLSRARWEYGREAGAILQRMPSALRPSTERLHDLTSTLEASIPETATNLSVAYRLNSAFTQEGTDGIAPIFDGRFDFQLRQALPYQPISGGRIDLLVSVSNLFRDPRNPGSFFDELLTVRTPKRVLGGVQVRF